MFIIIATRNEGEEGIKLRITDTLEKAKVLYAEDKEYLDMLSADADNDDTVTETLLLIEGELDKPIELELGGGCYFEEDSKCKVLLKDHFELEVYGNG